MWIRNIYLFPLEKNLTWQSRHSFSPFYTSLSWKNAPQKVEYLQKAVVHRAELGK